MESAIHRNKKCSVRHNETAKTMENVSYFTDCATSPYLGAINLLYEFNIISGAGDGKFNPDAYLTYPQVGKIMVNVLLLLMLMLVL